MAYIKFNRSADSSLLTEASFRQNKDEVQSRLEIQWSVRRPEAPVPRADELLDFMADDLEDSRTQMLGSLSAHLNETDKIVLPRDDRQGAFKDLRYWYQFARDIYVDIYGEEEARGKGFVLVTERHPWRLARGTRRVIGNFKEMDPEAKIMPKDEPKEPMAITAGYVVSLLESPCQKLEDVLSSLVYDSRETDKTLIRKNADYDVYEKKYTRYAGLGEALYRAVGMDEEAARIRPSVRRPGLREQVVADLEGPEPDDASPAQDTQAEPAPAAP